MELIAERSDRSHLRKPARHCHHRERICRRRHISPLVRRLTEDTLSHRNRHAPPFANSWSHHECRQLGRPEDITKGSWLFHAPGEEGLTKGSSSNSEEVQQQFPTKRRVVRLDMSTDSQKDVDKWFAESKILLRDVIPDQLETARNRVTTVVPRNRDRTP